MITSEECNFGRELSLAEKLAFPMSFRCSIFGIMINLVNIVVLESVAAVSVIYV
jgi:hypothetical protein